MMDSEDFWQMVFLIRIWQGYETDVAAFDANQAEDYRMGRYDEVNENGD